MTRQQRGRQAWNYAARALRETINEQLRSRFGLDGNIDLLIIRVYHPTGYVEWHVVGATYKNKEALKAAGYTWDKLRHLWVTEQEQPSEIINPTGLVHIHDPRAIPTECVFEGAFEQRQQLLDLEVEDMQGYGQ